MATWQYYERDALIHARRTSGPALDLVVTSQSGAAPGSAERSHFAVAMFSRGRGADAIPVEDGLFRRPETEKRMQPMLDWMATNHHDYMRLNDFSEAFSLLRWLRSTGTSVLIIDAAPRPAAIATPDRVDIARGPHIGPR
jgi:hypothetical protein